MEHLNLAQLQELARLGETSEENTEEEPFDPTNPEPSVVVQSPRLREHTQNSWDEDVEEPLTMASAATAKRKRFAGETNSKQANIQTNEDNPWSWEAEREQDRLAASNKDALKSFKSKEKVSRSRLCALIQRFRAPFAVCFHKAPNATFIYNELLQRQKQGQPVVDKKVLSKLLRGEEREMLCVIVDFEQLPFGRLQVNDLEATGDTRRLVDFRTVKWAIYCTVKYYC